MLDGYLLGMPMILHTKNGNMSFIDVVYKLSDDPDNKVLKYSLRSLSRFVHLRNVYISGWKPDWVKNVIHIPVDDHYTLKNKDANIINKLIAACAHRDLSEHFLNMSDDMIFLKETNAPYFLVPRYNNAILYNPERYFSANYFHQRLLATVEKLTDRGLPGNCFETHGPYMLSKHMYPQIMMRYDYQHGMGLCGNTLYFNTLKEPGMPAYNHVYRLQRKTDVITPEINGFQFLNFNDDSELPPLFEYLENMFPDKSIYEI